MNKDNNTKLVPELRFKNLEGQEYSVWDEVKLSTLVSLVNTKNKEYKITRVLTNSAANGIVDQRDYFDKDIANINNLGGYYIVNYGDYVYNPRISNIAPVGPVSKNKIDTGVMSPLYMVFRFNNQDNDFYEQYFKTSHWYQYLYKVSNSGARFDRMSITPTIFLEMPVPFPNIEEQQKIADCLSSLDELIAANIEKLDALKSHKKGLMQRLFPAEGETIPQLRFPEFKNDGEWEEVKFGDLGEFTGGGTPSKDNDSFWDGNIPWVSSADIAEDSIHQFSISRFITQEALENSSTKKVPQNSILLVSRVGVGKLAITEQSVCTSQDFTNFTPDKDNLYFLAYCLKSKNKTLLEYSQGMAIKGFTKENIVKLIIRLPSIKEQKKIADCLSSLDELIEAISHKIEALKQHKKGLMQGLFPKNIE